MMDWSGHGTGGWGYGLTALIMILFWAAVIYGIVALVRYARPCHTGPEPVQPPTPERLLAERFARGQIDEDEYHQRLTSLRAAGPASTQQRS
jgi:putative membrane protein